MLVSSIKISPEDTACKPKIRSIKVIYLLLYFPVNESSPLVISKFKFSKTFSFFSGYLKNFLKKILSLNLNSFCLLKLSLNFGLQDFLYNNQLVFLKI